MIHSLKLAFTAKAAYLFLTGYQSIFLKPSLGKTNGEKGAWEVWEINEACTKRHFEQPIFQEPLYLDDNVHLVHEPGPGT